MQTKILMEFEVYGQTAEMLHIFFKQFADIYGVHIRALLSRKVKGSDIAWSDIVISVRSNSCLSARIAKVCKKSGRFHIAMLDDNLLNHRRDDVCMRIRKRMLLKVLAITDVVLTPNPLLIEYIESVIGPKRGAHIDTVVSEEEICTSMGDDRTLKILYYSNDGTNEYFKRILEDVICRIRVDSCVPIELDLIGMAPASFSAGQCIVKYLPHMSLSSFRKLLRDGKYAIGLAPLVANDNFSKYKYFNKFMELSAAGIVGVYSACPPNTFVVEKEVNGLLCENKPDAWLNAIERLLNSKDLRDRILKQAQITLRKRFSLTAVADNLVEQLHELTNYHAPGARIRSLWIYQAEYRVFCIFERCISSYRVLRESGLRSMVKRINEFFSTKKQCKKEFHKHSK